MGSICCAPQLGGWKHSHLFLFSLGKLWQGIAAALHQRGTAQTSRRTQHSGRRRSSESRALSWHLPPQPCALQPWLCPCRGSRTRRLHLSHPKDSGCSLSPCLTLSSCTLPRKHPFCPTPVLEVQAAPELLPGCCQPPVPAASPSPALGERRGSCAVAGGASCTRVQK